MSDEGYDCDVLVCGLGPVGALLALLLGRRGISVIVVERAPEPYPLPRAAVVDDEVLRIFQSAGVVAEVLADAQIQEEVSFVTVGGRKILLLRPVDGIQGHPPLVSINQPSLERTLGAALAQTAAVDVRRQHELLDLDQDADGVTATVRPVGGSGEAIRARWAVGCDGSASLVRQLLGIEYSGSTFQRWLVVDVLVDRPLAKVPHPHFYGDWKRPTVSLPMSPGRHRWEWMLHHGEEEAAFLEPEALRERIEPWLQGESAEIERAVVYTFHARMATRWREGRVLLAGDAEERDVVGAVLGEGHQGEALACAPGAGAAPAAAAGGGGQRESRAEGEEQGAREVSKRMHDPPRRQIPERGLRIRSGVPSGRR